MIKRASAACALSILAALTLAKSTFAQADCDGALLFEGELTSTRPNVVLPTATGARSSGLRTGCLNGPDGSNFQLMLFERESLEHPWRVVAVGTKPGSDESITYRTRGGQYAWMLYTASGEGRYRFTLDSPAQPQTVTPQNAARFLIQTTFGPNEAAIEKVQSMGIENWLEEQFELPPSNHLAMVDRLLRNDGIFPRAEKLHVNRRLKQLRRIDTWWHHAIEGEDQLRQRVAFALSEIMVVSDVDAGVRGSVRGLAYYTDILARHAFGNFRDLLHDVTLNPMMGNFLSMIQSQKSDPQKNIEPDENYARELMQLFSIGLEQLNLNGTPRKDAAGNSIPTFDNDVVRGFAKAFTGWDWGDATRFGRRPQSPNSQLLEMQPFDEFHDKGAKTLLNGRVLPSGQSAVDDLNDALDNVFAHRNVAPFIAKQLIQRLVTSNPSPAYVRRVAQVFNDNGLGVRGDMRAVIKALLLDDEARNGHITQPRRFGKLREPVLKQSALWRALDAIPMATANNNGERVGPRVYRYAASNADFAQRPLSALSVFNFFLPNFAQPGPIEAAGLVSPEFEILTDTTITDTTNALRGSIHERDATLSGARILTPSTAGRGNVLLDLGQEKALADDPEALINHLDLLLMAGQMSDTMRDALITFLDTEPTGDPRIRVEDTLFLLVTSPEFAVQR